VTRSARYVARQSEFVDERSEQNESYERVLGSNGLEHQLRVALVADGTHWGLLHIERRQPPFTSGEVALVDALVPHLAHAFRRWILADPDRPTTGARTPVTPGVIPSARLRLPTGTWLHVHATILSRPDDKRRTAVVLERASVDEVAPPIASAQRLRDREAQIALLVLRGLSTNEIAVKLFISAYTVQDHLKSIFEKTGVRSRRELVTEIFEPHLVA